MAKYFLRVKIFSRGKGSSATLAAAYRAGERIRDENSGRVHDFTDRADIVHSEIVLPSEYTNNIELDWARNRSELWNAVQRSGRVWNSRLAREVLVLLSPESSSAQRTALIRSFSQELADRYHCAVDFAVHLPRAGADPRSHHAHMLMTCREVRPQGLGQRTSLELGGRERHQRGLGPSKQELLWTRERWAQVANEALRNAGLKANLDHRSYADRGIDRETTARIPFRVFYAEHRTGVNTPAGDDLRLKHRERLEARRKGPEELDRVLRRQRDEARKYAVQSKERQRHARTIPTGAMTREQLNAKLRDRRKAHSAGINQKRREYYKAHTAEINEKRRSYRSANLAEINQQRREHRRANAAEVNCKQREYRKRSAERELKLALSVRERPIPSPAAHTRSIDPVVQKMLAYRESQQRIVRPDPVEKLREYRKAQMQRGNWTSKDAAQLGTVAHGTTARKDANLKQKRGPKNDLGL